MDTLTLQLEFSSVNYLVESFAILPLVYSLTKILPLITLKDMMFTYLILLLELPIETLFTMLNLLISQRKLLDGMTMNPRQKT